MSIILLICISSYLYTNMFAEIRYFGYLFSKLEYKKCVLINTKNVVLACIYLADICM